METARQINPKYPIGEQSFEKLRANGSVYVDKTLYIEKIIQSGSQYYFLGRPRRFGKSLFLSTLACFFEGKRHLFKGLYADSILWDWETHPVLYLDLNTESYSSAMSLPEILDYHLGIWEEKYGITASSDNVSLRFNRIIRTASQKTGKGVVVLVDEYDKPLVNNIHCPEQVETFRDQLASLYSNFKTCADYLRLVFLTGVSRFGRLSVFSGLNNLRDISLENEYAAICGITEQELIDNFCQGINDLAKDEGLSAKDAMAELKRFYDGYHFSRNLTDIYNPYSLLNAFEKKQLGNYWIESGYPTLLVQQLRKFDTDLGSLFEAECFEEELKQLDIDSSRPIALLYQTGYLTICGYDRTSRLYSLRLPNEEVKVGFLNFLLPHYADFNGASTSRFSVHRFVEEFRNGDVESFMKRLESLFASIPYDMHIDQERNLHNVLLMLMILVGLEVQTEYRTSDGRIDLFIKTDRFYYIIELKVNSSAKVALNQIKDKGYALPFATDNRRIIKIGVNFSTEKRRITGWLSES